MRNQAQEIINNLHIIQYALRHSTDPTMNAGLSQCLRSYLSDRRDEKSNNRVQAHHIQKKEDACVRRLFPDSNIKYFQSLHIGRCRLSTRAYAHGKTTDDSNIVFNLNGNEQFGRIRSIIRVDSNEPLLFVAQLSDTLPLVCSIDDLEDHTYSRIQISSHNRWSFVLVEVKDFIEKSALYESPDGRCYFFRFPNLTHCS
jgi:hypothetical protein